MSAIEQPTSGRPALAARDTEPLVSVVIPCLNEAENIEQCVRSARAAMDEHGLSGEVVVADNGSTDGSGALAAAAGARVVHEPRPGYGSAYLAGFAAARGASVHTARTQLRALLAKTRTDRQADLVGLLTALAA